MHLAVTIKTDSELKKLRPLIEAVREHLSSENVTVLEAPKGIDYAYPFPVVTISEGPSKVRHFGTAAVDVLKSYSR